MEPRLGGEHPSPATDLGKGTQGGFPGEASKSPKSGDGLGQGNTAGWFPGVPKGEAMKLPKSSNGLGQGNPLVGLSQKERDTPQGKKTASATVVYSPCNLHGELAPW